jgi:hypothetical protein
VIGKDSVARAMYCRSLLSIAAPEKTGWTVDGVEGSSSTRWERHGVADARIMPKSACRSVLTGHLLHVSSISDQIRVRRSAFSPSPLPHLSLWCHPSCSAAPMEPGRFGMCPM